MGAPLRIPSAESICLMKTRSTTILTIRHKGKVAMGGDGQVSMGQTVVKADAQKIRRLMDDRILVGFAGARPTRSPSWSDSRPS